MPEEQFTNVDEKKIAYELFLFLNIGEIGIVENNIELDIHCKSFVVGMLQ